MLSSNYIKSISEMYLIKDLRICFKTTPGQNEYLYLGYTRLQNC